MRTVHGQYNHDAASPTTLAPATYPCFLFFLSFFFPRATPPDPLAPPAPSSFAASLAALAAVHAALCPRFQSTFWHALEQYGTMPHAAQVWSLAPAVRPLPHTAQALEMRAAARRSATAAAEGAGRPRSMSARRCRAFSAMRCPGPWSGCFSVRRMTRRKSGAASSTLWRRRS